ncbi:hypothetical protein C3L33_16989, partial [Rhododendron williamsianum]
MQKRVSRAVLSGTLSSNTDQLQPMGPVRAADGAPEQHPSPDHQRGRCGDRAGLSASLPRYSDRRKKLRVVGIMLVECVILAALAILVMTLAHTTRRLGEITLASLDIAHRKYAKCTRFPAEMWQVKMVISTRSVEYMPLSLSLASLANGICWTTYAVIRFDPFIAINQETGIGKASEMGNGPGATTISGLDSTKTSRVAQKGHAPYVNGT